MESLGESGEKLPAYLADVQESLADVDRGILSGEYDIDAITVRYSSAYSDKYVPISTNHQSPFAGRP